MGKKFNLSRNQYLGIIAILIAVYYLVCGIYLKGLGYINQETLFYAEKIKIIFEGQGYKLKVIGLTYPALPFFATFFFAFDPLLAPVIASGIGTAMLFFLMATTLIKKTGNHYYLLLLILLFLFHPGLLYVACSGKSVYMVLIFFYMFFLNIFKFYTSKTTFHISIASICLVLLLFCDYKFIWLTLFFIPLVFFIALQTLNLAEKESIFRMTQSFNSPSLRRKLVNKTFALYAILFLLPIASIVCYKMLNLSNANDADYFIESPYSTWTVMSERLIYEKIALSADFKSQEISLLITAKVIMFCPLILFAFYMFRRSNYQILTLVTPFAFVEFLHVKYDKVFLVYQYYLIFLILTTLCLVIKARPVRNVIPFKPLLFLAVLAHIFTGYLFLKKSLIDDERNFVTTLFKRAPENKQGENIDMANYINGLPRDVRILADDAVAYQIVAYTRNMSSFTLPYQENYLTAIESPGNYDDYILIATEKNVLSPYTLLNEQYGPIVYQSGNMQKVYQTENWTLYKIL